MVRNSSFKSKTYLLCILLVAVLLPVGCKKKAEQTLRVGANVWPGYESLYLARHLGYYNGKPIKLIEYPSATKVIFEYRSNKIDVAALTMDEAFLLAQYEKDFKIVLVMDVSNGGDAIVSKDIKKLADIKGKRVGVEDSALGSYMLTRALEKAGLQWADIVKVPLKFNEHEKAYNEDFVDVIVTFEPVKSTLAMAGANILFDSGKIPGEIIDVLIARKSALAHNKSAVRDLINGWSNAVEYIKEKPEKAVGIMALHERVTAGQFLKSLKGLRLPDMEENRRLFSNKRETLLARTRRLCDIMVKNNLLKQPVDPNTLLNDSFLLE